MHVEGFQSAQHGNANTAGGDSADMHALDVVGPCGAVGDVPTALHYPLMGRNVVPHESEDHHHHVFGDAYRIAVGHLGDRYTAVDRGLKVDVIGADAGGDGELQLLRFGDALGRQIGRPEGLRDHDICVSKLALKDRVCAVLVRSHNESVAIRFEIFAQSEPARHAAEKRARLEVDALWRWKSLAAWITLDLRYIVARIR